MKKKITRLKQMAEHSLSKLSITEHQTMFEGDAGILNVCFLKPVVANTSVCWQFPVCSLSFVAGDSSNTEDASTWHTSL